MEIISYLPARDRFIRLRHGPQWLDRPTFPLRSAYSLLCSRSIGQAMGRTRRAADRSLAQVNGTGGRDLGEPLPSSPQKKFNFSTYLKYLFVYDEYIDNMEMYEMFTLERGLAIPERKTSPKYPYEQLELGDSFYIQDGDLAKLCNANYREWRRTGKKYTARKVDKGVRVWRIE